ncbi:MULTISPECIES: elongation factor P [Desulfofundulus]|uniref:Elongation factor P n=1 Tax=Desulfofundulus australicus DSM 11792 TaxID=1121425 RepID=A0A1M5CUY7_9FIRM|nr:MULTISPECIES: elongation factor P [Desulfofundulus]MBE3584709.1 elongation factor P [Thermoanaerobacter sp.]MCS5694805.1 elongation factor P [Desulfofundulus thermocisternus]MDK2887553.1 elongation factor [Thermoanaerobacter sp.]SHF58578.1 elongation factor P [Desulfofundulus australicus DSM 11792]
MISTNDFRTGLTIELDGDVYQVIDFQHVKPGKGAAFVRSKLRNLRTGAVIEKTFNAGEKIPRAHVERREVQYLYNDGTSYNFMDMETFDQFSMTREQLGDAVNFLKENMTINLLMFQGRSIGVDLPNFVELKVVDTPPGIKGDTASGGSKPATLETGYVVQVPFFVEVGDVLQIDTRTGQYIKRV